MAGMAKSILAALLAALALACTGDSIAGNRRTAAFGRNTLVTQYRIRDGREIAVVHVFFVPHVESVGNGMVQTNMGGVSSVHRSELRYSFVDHERHIAIDAAPVVIVKDRVVQAGGRSFDLTRGNVFVADVALNGAVTLRQVPAMFEAKETSPDDVLAAISGRR